MEFGRRPALESDREFAYGVKCATLRYAIEATWGWDEDRQRRRWEEHWRPEEMEILLEGQEPVGYVKVRREADALRLLSIYLLPPWQSRGIGTSILEALIRDAVDRGVALRLRVLKPNERARALYERLGFRTTRTTDTHHEMEWASPRLD